MEQRQKYTVEYVERLPEDARAELIDGELYNMATPSGTHQEIQMLLSYNIYDYIKKGEGHCKVFTAPYAVYLDEYTFLEPDVAVICDKSKLDYKGCHGAPDWFIEITSPSTSRIDYIKKLNKYDEAGVRLYWIVNPITQKVLVWYFERGDYIEYSFGNEIPVDIYPDLSITIPKDIGWDE